MQRPRALTVIRAACSPGPGSARRQPVGQLRERGKLPVRLPPVVGRVAVPVDPGGRETERPRGNDVVEVALADVEPPARADRAAGRLEMGAGRLVRAHLL